MDVPVPEVQATVVEEDSPSSSQPVPLPSPLQAPSPPPPQALDDGTVRLDFVGLDVDNQRALFQPSQGCEYSADAKTKKIFVNQRYLAISYGGSSSRKGKAAVENPEPSSSEAARKQAVQNKYEQEMTDIERAPEMDKKKPLDYLRKKLGDELHTSGFLYKFAGETWKHPRRHHDISLEGEADESTRAGYAEIANRICALEPPKNKPAALKKRLAEHRTAQWLYEPHAHELPMPDVTPDDFVASLFSFAEESASDATLPVHMGERPPADGPTLVPDVWWALEMRRRRNANKLVAGLASLPTDLALDGGVAPKKGLALGALSNSFIDHPRVHCSRFFSAALRWRFSHPATPSTTRAQEVHDRLRRLQTIKASKDEEGKTVAERFLPTACAECQKMPLRLLPDFAKLREEHIRALKTDDLRYGCVCRTPFYSRCASLTRGCCNEYMARLDEPEFVHRHLLHCRNRNGDTLLHVATMTPIRPLRPSLSSCRWEPTRMRSTPTSAHLSDVSFVGALATTAKQSSGSTRSWKRPTCSTHAAPVGQAPLV